MARGSGQQALKAVPPEGAVPEYFEAETTAHVHRRYRIKVGPGGVEQAQQRLRLYLRDPDVMAEGLVVPVEGSQRDQTQQRILSIEPVFAEPEADGDGEETDPGDAK